MTTRAKRCCLLLLTMLPITSVSFAAQSALSVAQISGGTASDTDLQGNTAESHFH
jgi:hypothetical protein